jgi:hypothetical protein
MRRAVIVVLSIAAASPAVAQRNFRPVDQAAAQPDFLAFRTLTLDALARREAQSVLSVLSVVHADIRNSFGGHDGIKEFEEFWKLDDPDSPFWATMTAVLRLGGTFSADHTFEAPYVFSAWPVAVLSHVIVEAPTDYRAINASTPTPGAGS